MTYAYVLIKTDQGKQNDALTKIGKMNGVENVHTVTGPYDIIAYVGAEDMASLGRTVISKIQNLNMIKDTMTCIVLDLL